MERQGLSAENLTRGEAMIACYPQRRSALLPLCHLAQSEHGYLTPASMEDIAKLIGCSPAEVRGTASFYDMLHTEPVGRYVFAVCTNIACMLAGAYEVLSHAERRLGIRVGQTTHDEMFTLEEAECLAGCDKAVCVQVNHRFFGPMDEDAFDQLVDDLAEGRLADTVPPHGVLSRVSRTVGLPAKAAKATKHAQPVQPAASTSAPATAGTAAPATSGTAAPAKSATTRRAAGGAKKSPGKRPNPPSGSGS
jgi:NADH-quinone oxidoreductase subunit E